MQLIRLSSVWHLVLPFLAIGPKTVKASLPASALPFQYTKETTAESDAETIPNLRHFYHNSAEGRRVFVSQQPAFRGQTAQELRASHHLVLLDSLGGAFLVQVAGDWFDTLRLSASEGRLLRSYFRLVPVRLVADDFTEEKTKAGKQHHWWVYAGLILLLGFLTLGRGPLSVRRAAAPTLAPVGMPAPVMAAPMPAPAVSEADQALVAKVYQIVSEHYGDEHFALPVLCQKMAMSRSQLFRKLQKAGEMAPSDFIRHYRLQQASVLLETTAMTVSEIAWQVGYKDLAHFSKSFQEKYGIAPTEMRKVGKIK